MFIKFVQSEFKKIFCTLISMRKGTAILIGFNCRFWAMQNSNENVYMCAMSGKTEIDRERERERERE